MRHPRRVGKPAGSRPSRPCRNCTLAFNDSHLNEHYGNLVTYMRLKGIVPPSSEPK